MKSYDKAYGFLISALLCVFIFTFSVAITLVLFTAADRVNYSSINKTIGVQMAQREMERSVAEAELFDEEQLQDIAEKPTEEWYSEKMLWSGQERLFHISKQMSAEPVGRGYLLQLSIKIVGFEKSGEHQELIVLQTAKYINEVMQWEE